jgi:hypothetical protein
LADFLLSQPKARKIEDDSNAPADSSFVTVSFDRGSVYLTPLFCEAPSLRLVWTGRLPARRPVPPGTYRVSNYVIERVYEGRPWMISCSGTEGPVVNVVAGSEERIEIDPRLHLDWTATRTKDRIDLALVFTGHDGMLASLFDIGNGTTDRRRPATFRILSADNSVLGTGALSYG